ncbi:MAG TPA: hypothetical protein PKY31_07920 [Spirochaetota bacterium]|nr:hypothetical protein [Spirochaetota bacterium]
MRFTLENGDLRDFRELFRPGNIWSSIRKDPEAMRFWHLLREVHGETWIQHGTGSVAKITVRQDRIKSVELLQGDQAEEILRHYGFQVPEEHHRRGRKFLKPGRLLTEALEEGWPHGFGIEPLSQRSAGDGVELYRYRLSWGGVLEVKTDGKGRIRSHRWFEGSDALDVLNGR